MRACLKDDALNVIRSIENSSENYEIAWNILKDRFDNRRIIIQKHVKVLFEIPLINRESVNGIRTIIDNLQSNLRGLKSLGENVDSWDTLLIHAIVGKLDVKTRMDLSERQQCRC